MVTNVTQLIDFMFFYMNIIILEQKKPLLVERLPLSTNQKT